MLNVEVIMNTKISAVRGMRDILPDEISYWHFIEEKLRQLTFSFGYSEIRLPILENTELFKRSVGQVTDIVEKEMYTFDDRNGDSLTLRPEGTAGVVRAGVEHSLFYGNTPKVWYFGPMFRHERPQKGRYRQFYQFGLEAFGVKNHYIDLEVLVFCSRLWVELGLNKKIKLQINCLGTLQERLEYRDVLVAYFKDNYNSLDNDSKNRLEKNPLRILDSKNPELKQVISNAPKLIDYLGAESREHMQNLLSGLDKLEINYEVNPFLVRGLDYYCLTVFEWVTDELGAQGTVCAGGRYDSLVSEIGGQDTPAIGMSLGVERLVLMLQNESSKPDISENLDIYMVLVGSNSIINGFKLAEEIRNALPGIKLNLNLSDQPFKNQLKKADKSGAKIALIIGEDEVKNNQVTVKWLREHKEQQSVFSNCLINFLSENI